MACERQLTTLSLSDNQQDNSSGLSLYSAIVLPRWHHPVSPSWLTDRSQAQTYLGSCYGDRLGATLRPSAAWLILSDCIQRCRTDCLVSSLSVPSRLTLSPTAVINAGWGRPPVRTKLDWGLTVCVSECGCVRGWGCVCVQHRPVAP